MEARALVVSAPWHSSGRARAQCVCEPVRPAVCYEVVTPAYVAHATGRLSLPVRARACESRHSAALLEETAF